MKSDGLASGSWENTGKMFVAIKEYDVWGIRNKQELMDVYRETDFISETKKRKSTMGRTCVKNATKKRNVKKLFKNIPEGKRSVGKPRNRWLELLKMI